jgi:hypothetical protein
VSHMSIIRGADICQRNFNGRIRCTRFTGLRSDREVPKIVAVPIKGENSTC